MLALGTQPNFEVPEPSPKVPRKKSPFGGMFVGSRAKGDEDNVSEPGMESEAETEIMDKAGMDLDGEGREGKWEEKVEADQDPYAAVAPETIREGQRKTEE